MEAATMSFRGVLLMLWALTPAIMAFPTVLRRSAFRPSFGALFAERQATFGMGCFWEPSESLLDTEGVIDTVVGYTGNPSASTAPSYESVCQGRQWVEAVRVTYDDSKLDYDQLLDAFFENQKPQMGSRQYSSIIFFANDQEQKQAEEWLQQNDKRMRNDGVSIAMTSLEALSPFYQAEGYHQRFWQKQRPRIAVAIALLAVASGVLDPIVPEQFQASLETAANAAYIAGAIGLLLERKLDAKVFELS